MDSYRLGQKPNPENAQVSAREMFNEARGFEFIHFLAYLCKNGFDYLVYSLVALIDFVDHQEELMDSLTENEFEFVVENSRRPPEAQLSELRDFLHKLVGSSPEVKNPDTESHESLPQSGSQNLRIRDRDASLLEGCQVAEGCFRYSFCREVILRFLSMPKRNLGIFHTFLVDNLEAQFTEILSVKHSFDEHIPRGYSRGDFRKGPMKPRVKTPDERFVLRHGRKKMGVFKFPSKSNFFCVGRDHRAKGMLKLDDQNLSRNHAVFQFDERNCIMFDLSSHGHTKVNDRQVSYAHLQHGDKISLGSVTEYFFYIEKRSKVMNAVRHASRSSFRTPRRFRPPDRTRSASAVNRHLSASVPRQRNDAWKSHSLRRAHSEMRESSAPGAENAALSGHDVDEKNREIHGPLEKNREIHVPLVNAEDPAAIDEPRNAQHAADSRSVTACIHNASIVTIISKINLSKINLGILNMSSPHDVRTKTPQQNRDCLRRGKELRLLLAERGDLLCEEVQRSEPSDSSVAAPSAARKSNAELN